MESAPDQASTRKTTFARWSRSFAIGLYAMMMVAGAVQILSPENGAVYLTCALLCALLATGWADCDTRARGITILPVLYMLYFIFWPGGAVVYLLYRSGSAGS